MDRNFNFVYNSFKLFIISKNRQVTYINFLNKNTITKNLIFSVIFAAVGLFFILWGLTSRMLIPKQIQC